jgi:HAD superfamily hydrolase (TIGR01490 family)
MPRDVVVFDLDGTLTAADTSLPFLRAVAGPWPLRAGVLWAGLCAPLDLARAGRAEARAGAQGLGSVRGRWEGLLHERVTARTLAGRPLGALEEAAASFAEAVLQTRLRPDAAGRIAPHREAGHRLVLASASLELYAVPLGELLGFDQVVGTRLEVRDGVASGRFDGLPCWGREKLRRVEEGLDPDRGDVLIHAYGDSRGDSALLQAARRSTYVR